ncbi:MAG TPA: tRNA pseudouridine synthase A, partial [Xanthomonadaceae bacterium]|nr:tRNA pseudouridine synthase A [Xanthomonadaceae bacterium]
LDAVAMHQAAQALLGEHDFGAFRTVHCQAPHARRDLQAISVQRDDDEVRIEVRANAFLHHMVRNIVGSLLLVGRGVQPPDWIGEVLQSRDRRLAGPTAPAQGLCFLGPLYPPECGLPGEVTLQTVSTPARDMPSSRANG